MKYKQGKIIISREALKKNTGEKIFEVSDKVVNVNDETFLAKLVDKILENREKNNTD